MDTSAVFQLTYGLFVIGAAHEGQRGGCVTNTVIQVTNTPVQIAITMAKENFTHDLIQKSGLATVSVLGEEVDNKVFGYFGFRKSTEIDKWAGFSHANNAQGLPYLTEPGVLSWLSGQVVHQLDVGTHTMFVVELDEGENLEKGVPMSYAYYRKERKGHAPKAAPTYRSEDASTPAEEEKVPSGENIAFKCDICNYLLESGYLPADYTCPICSADRTHFHPIYKRIIEEAESRDMKCKVCGFKVTEDELVTGYRCPLCGTTGDAFEPVES